MLALPANMLAIHSAGLHLTATCSRYLQMEIRPRLQAAFDPKRSRDPHPVSVRFVGLTPATLMAVKLIA